MKGKRKQSDMRHKDERGRRSKQLPDVHLERLAEEVGISGGHLSRVLRGERNPSLTVTRKLAVGLNLTVDQLLATLAAAATPSTPLRRGHKAA